MWEKFRIIFTIPELRQKIGLTLLLLAIYRVGFWIPLPIVDPAQMQKFFSQGEGGELAKMLNAVATFSATQLDQASIFGLGIMPYISASIIFQLLASVYKPLEELQKEGEAGRKKINEYTRYATVFLCMGQSLFYIKWLASPQLQMVKPEFLVDGGLPMSWFFVSVLTMTAGTVFLMWLGEQIDEYGIGNGISLLIMAGILSRMPSAGLKLIQPILQNGLQLGGSGGGMGIETLLILAVLFIAVVCGVIFIYQGQRRIPMQSAKHVKGRKVYGGTRHYLPLKVNQANVMPIIFASSLMMFPQFLFTYLSNAFPTAGWLGEIGRALGTPGAFTYTILFVALIFFFCYFWTAVSFNPKDMAENLKSSGSFIPGHRPGKRTADYLEKVMVRITYVGAAFLSLVAIVPTVVSGTTGIDYQIAGFYGGTSLLIAVSVAFDLVQKIDSHLVMRNYRGLLER